MYIPLSLITKGSEILYLLLSPLLKVTLLYIKCYLGLLKCNQFSRYDVECLSIVVENHGGKVLVLLVIPLPEEHVEKKVAVIRTRVTCHRSNMICSAKKMFGTLKIFHPSTLDAKRMMLGLTLVVVSIAVEGVNT
jgi:hypothetical protein